MCVCKNKETKVRIEEISFKAEGSTHKCPVQVERCASCGEEILNGKFALQNSMAMREIIMGM